MKKPLDHIHDKLHELIELEFLVKSFRHNCDALRQAIMRCNHLEDEIGQAISEALRK